MITCEVKKQLRDFELDIQFQIQKETLVIVGHSGCGKSTTLRAISGLLTPDDGKISVDGQDYFNKKEKINLSPEERGIGFLFQDYALFPHLTVFENVAYGLAAQKVSKKEQRKRVKEQLEMLDILKFIDKMPSELSGGQQQRVALARALILKPKVLLLDEPLSALDVTTRDSVRRELKKMLAELEIPAIIVTHDYEDAISLGERILVMDQGVVLQEGSPQELIQQPGSSFVADFSGTNFFGAKAVGTKGGYVQLNVAPWGQSLLSVYKGDGDLSLVIHPWDIHLSKEKPKEASVNVIHGKVSHILTYGNRQRIYIEGTIPLMVESVHKDIGSADISEGDQVYAVVDPSYVHVLNKTG